MRVTHSLLPIHSVLTAIFEPLLASGRGIGDLVAELALTVLERAGSAAAVAAVTGLALAVLPLLAGSAAAVPALTGRALAVLPLLAGSATGVLAVTDLALAVLSLLTGCAAAVLAVTGLALAVLSLLAVAKVAGVAFLRGGAGF